MVECFYYTKEDKENHILRRMEECPPRIGEAFRLYDNQTNENLHTMYAVDDVITTGKLYGADLAIKIIVLRKIVRPDQIILGGQGEVENP